VALQTGTSYEFGPFRLEPAERRLLRNGQEVPLSPKTFEVLVALVCRAGHLVTKEELLSEVWRGTFVEEANLSYTVSLLRRALQSGADDERYIDTVQKLGYRFSGAVRTLAAGDRPLEPAAALSGAPDGPVEAAPGSTSSNVTGREPWHRHRRWRLAAVAIAALVLGLATIPFFRQTEQVAPQSLLRFDQPLPAHITLTRFDQPAISPDGRRVAFTGLSGGTRQLWVRDLTGPPTDTVLPGTDGAMMPFWSPDSRRLAFYADRKLKMVDVDGGSVRTVCGGLRSPGIFSAHG
jgi:DNA-binding winged helix-turn-helix (wHTH) protein